MQLRKRLDDAKLSGYDVRLPTELQWERAARAQSLSAAHADRWPWGDEASVAAQRANVRTTELGGTSSVGLFAPNAIGLHDMAGNVWEWMDNRFEPSKGKAFARVQAIDTYDQVAKDDMSLRGGSWVDNPEDASCSSRDWFLPVNSFNYFGVRVVLSLA